MLIRQLRADHYMVSLQVNPFSERLMNAIVSYVAYLGKTFWPSCLAVFYPYEHSFQLWEVSGAAAVLLVISLAVICLIKRIPFLAVGWFWYLGTLFPVIGFMQAGSQAMADRYTYLPSIGIGIMLTWGIVYGVYLLPRENLRKIILIPMAAIVVITLTVLTFQQCGHWKNSISLFSHVLHVTKNNYKAHDAFGVALDAEGKHKEAIYHYRQELKIQPDNFGAHYNLGIALVQKGEREEAIKHFRAAIYLRPDSEAARRLLHMLLDEE